MQEGFGFPRWPIMHRCDKCGRESNKTKRDLEKIHGWKFVIICGQEVAKCGDCNKIGGRK